MGENRKKELFSWVKSIAFAFILALLIRQFLFTPVVVSGESMFPTFENDNRIVISKVSKINHFDMIVFHAPDSEDDFIKRVIGLPGDVVVMEDDKLYINGKQYVEEYVQANKAQVFEGQMLTQDFEVEVPEGYLYVLGDNRRRSTDSREIGFIDEKSVVGKVSFRFYPLKEIGIPK
ncbi:signal peptidase I [Sporosarcina sp. G11-34]|uniref:signal peptidase I n=1 Tax=Sporosarcina sp. G11-34 TaxID=2849605 RepID=UPI0022A94891|nr:signal peptidase I [Sporosarcina sp. G11-34]MCZ2257706.1 signal peptidase I [Sporosarcina sp. G11-34]